MFYFLSYDAGHENVKLDVKIEEDRQNARKDKNSKEHFII